MFSHRIHRIHRSLLLRRNSHRFVGGYGIPAIPTHPVTVIFSHRFHGFTQMVRLRSGLPQNTQNSQKFIAEKKLPQNSRIYTDVSKMFCVFREFCGRIFSASLFCVFREFCGRIFSANLFCEFCEFRGSIILAAWRACQNSQYK